MRFLFLALLGFLLSHKGNGQGFTNSNLPIVIINTDLGAAIPDEPKVLATMKIIYRGPGQRNYVTDQSNAAYLSYDGRIGIELRGSSTQVTYKKQYGFTTRKADNITSNNVKLLDMPAENDWVLNGMVFDPAVIRDYLCYNLSRQIGAYASRTAYCELIINNAYQGLYLLQEKIKADDNRVDVLKISGIDNAIPAVTGGYITKADKNTGGDPTAFTMYSRNYAYVNYIHHLPEPDVVTGPQQNYISSQFLLLESRATNSNIINGYPAVIDIPSFINYMLISELGSNADAYMFSTYFHKDRNGKLRAGPIWDNDLTYGNDLYFWGLDRSWTNVWQFSNDDNEGSRFWYDLFNDPEFRCYLSKRWYELTRPGQPLHLASLEAFIDATVAGISEAVVRENALWGSIGNHAQHISNIKLWLSARINWMTANIGPHDGCQDVAVPPLVITKIMYHPGTSLEFPEEDDQEFIEITNNSDQPVNLTGIYFSHTGLTYQFPQHAVVGAHEAVVIASNISVFRSRYNCAPFDQYTRHLSNKSQLLVLADAFGNIIDKVQYIDTIPWPEADGNGYYLQLTDPALDNALAENWTASNEVIVTGLRERNEMEPAIYPNPVQHLLHIQATNEMQRITLSDMQGRLLIDIPVHHDRVELDISRFGRGTYILRITGADMIYTGKIIKD